MIENLEAIIKSEIMSTQWIVRGLMLLLALMNHGQSDVMGVVWRRESSSSWEKRSGRP